MTDNKKVITRRRACQLVKKSTKNVYFCDNFVPLHKLETPQPT